MRATLASRTVLALAMLMLLGACNTPFDPPPVEVDVSTGEQAPEPESQTDKGKGFPQR
jgi:hypothetical protein